MSFRKSLRVLSLSISIFLTGTVGAQVTSTTSSQEKTDFSQEDYQKFVDLNMELVPIQKEAQGHMMEAIKSSGLEMQRFQQLAQAQQQGNLKEVSKDAGEMAKFNKAGQKVMELQQNMQQEIQQSISESDMDVQTFQQMSMAYSQNQEVKTKIDAMMAEKMDKG